MTGPAPAMNIALRVAEQTGGLDEYWMICMELVDAVLHVRPDADILWVNLRGHIWGYHAVPVIDGVVHDAWHPESMLPVEEYVQSVFGEYAVNYDVTSADSPDPE